jgi:hypothetical protein
MPSSRRWRKKVTEVVQREVASRGLRTHEANVSLVAEAIKRWELQFEAGEERAGTKAEFIVAVLEQEGRLA